MKKYETVVIFRTEGDSVAKGIAAVQQEFKNVGINILDQVDMGLRTLAYAIKKSDKGHYIVFNIESDPEKIKPVDKSLKLREEILKFVFFKKETPPAAKA